MSRHHFTPPGWPAHRSCVIGWDDSLESYFALVLGEDGQVIASAGGGPPPFAELDNLMRVINDRIKGQLPPVRLAGEHRRALAADAKRPIVNAISIAAPGAEKNPPAKPSCREPALLGTLTGFLDADGLHDVLDGMADTFCRLEGLYHARIAASADGGDIQRIRDALGSMEIVCHLLASMVQTPRILVASSALEPFRELAANAGRILHGEAAGIPSRIVH